MDNASATGYPTLQDFSKYQVGINGKMELIWQPLYDWNIYPLAGVAQILAFNTQQGQGNSAQPIAAAAPKSAADSNLQISGMLPAPQAYWVEGIEVQVDPGGTATANLYAVAPESVFLGTAAAASTTTLNDANRILRSGLLTMTIMQKVYYQESPLYRLPPRTNVKYAGDVAICGTNAQPGSLATMQALAEGQGVHLDPGLGIASMTNFGVTLSWPGLVPTTAPGSGFNARIGVFLNGWLFRAAQ